MMNPGEEGVVVAYSEEAREKNDQRRDENANVCDLGM